MLLCYLLIDLIKILPKYKMNIVMKTYQIKLQNCMLSFYPASTHKNLKLLLSSSMITLQNYNTGLSQKNRRQH